MAEKQFDIETMSEETKILRGFVAIANFVSQRNDIDEEYKRALDYAVACIDHLEEKQCNDLSILSSINAIVSAFGGDGENAVKDFITLMNEEEPNIEA